MALVILPIIGNNTVIDTGNLPDPADLVPEAPQDGQLYGRQDAAWVAATPADDTQSTPTTPSGQWQYKADPTNGGDLNGNRVGTDTGMPATATKFYITRQTQNGINAQGFIEAIQVGTKVYGWERRNTSNWFLFTVTAPPVYTAPYYEIGVQPAAGQGAEPNDWAEVQIQLTY